FLNSVGGHIALAIERRRSEESLRKKEEMFRLLFSHNPLPTWVIDRETLRFLEENEAAVRVYGYSQEEFRRMTILDIRPEEEKIKVLQYFQKSKGDGLHRGHWKRSEEHTSELQSHLNIVCRLLLEKKNCERSNIEATQLAAGNAIGVCPSKVCECGANYVCMHICLRRVSHTAQERKIKYGDYGSMV